MKENIVKKILVFILWPFSYLWESIYKIRRSFYLFGLFKQYEFKVPIISVGNLTFGGTGKTPFTMLLSRYFSQKGKRIMVLTRGYKGRLEKSSGLLKAGKKLGFNPFDYGDEALLLAKNLENTYVAVGRDRVSNLRKYFNEVQPDVIVLDDGHQHLKLRRNLNVVLFDSLLPLSSYRVAPSGYLREGMDALSAADIVILNRTDQVPPEKVVALKKRIESHLNPGVLLLETSYEAQGIFDSEYQKKFEVSGLQDKRLICFAGIATPESFFALVESSGGEIVERITFSDHYEYFQEDIDRLVALAKEKDCLLLTTEKDIVKVRNFLGAGQVCYIEVSLGFTKGEENLYKLLDDLMC